MYASRQDSTVEHAPSAASSSEMTLAKEIIKKLSIKSQSRPKLLILPDKFSVAIKAHKN